MKTTDSVIVCYLVTLLSAAQAYSTWAFFIKRENKFIPLTSAPHNAVSDASVLAYEREGPIVEFVLKDNYAINKQGSSPVFVGIYKNQFAFGQDVPPYRYILNPTDEIRIDDQKFYLCDSPDKKGQIIKLNQHKCPQVKIHILPFDKETSGPANGTYKLDPELDSNIETIIKQKDLKSSPNFPFVFFVKIGNRFVPLTSTYSESDDSNRILIWSSMYGQALQVSYLDGFTFTTFTNTPGYVGFKHNLLSFGLTVPRTYLKLDDNMKILNTQFYTCINEYGLKEITTKKLYKACHRSQIYLLPWDRTKKAPLENWKGMTGEVAEKFARNRWGRIYKTKHDMSD